MTAGASAAISRGDRPGRGDPDDPAVTAERWGCWLEVDLDAVAHNVGALQAAAQPRCGVTAVVKAQAYGLGALAVTDAARRAGARGVAVARLGEARLLRDGGYDGPILVLGGATAAELEEAVRLGVTPTVTTWNAAENVARAAFEQGVIAPVQVKVDTGLTRFGAGPSEAAALVRSLAGLPSIRLEGFFTHFAAADDPDPFFAHQQLARYRALCDELEGEGIDLGLKHVANSAGALRIPGAGLDTIRPGIALSGSYATGWVPRDQQLRSAVALKARVVRLHAPPIGSSIGYGRTFKVYRPMRVALISIGYADGLPRACSNRGRVLIRGQRAPLVGTVSMDAAMADVTHLPDVQPGDEVVVLGRQGDDAIDVDELAESAGVIPHELLVRLGARLPRLYLEGGQVRWVGFLSTDSLAPPDEALGGEPA